MPRRRTRPAVALLLGVCATLAGCTGDGADDAAPASSAAPGASAPSPCRTAVDAIVAATGRYAQGYDVGRSVSAAEATAAPPGGTTTTAPQSAAASEAEFQQDLAAAEQVLTESRCNPAEVDRDLTAGLAALDAPGPVGDAVIRQLTASLTGRFPREPTNTVVAVGDDLHQAVAVAPDRSTIELAPGVHRLDAPLVLLTGVQLHGAGRDATTLVSTAGEAAVLVLTDERVELRGLTVRREGDSAGSAVLGGPAASLVVADARVTGGRADASGAGGAGILMYGEVGDAARPGTSLEVTGTEVRDNAAAGIVLGGGHRASVVGAVFAGNGQCGICFLAAATGSVEDSTFESNGVGIAATDAAQPVLLRLAVTGGEVGLQAGADAAPRARGLTVTGARRAAVIYTDRAAGSLEDLWCVRVPFGIVVGPEASPQVGTTNCEVVAAPA